MKRRLSDQTSSIPSALGCYHTRCTHWVNDYGLNTLHCILGLKQNEEAVPPNFKQNRAEGNQAFGLSNWVLPNTCGVLVNTFRVFLCVRVEKPLDQCMDVIVCFSGMQKMPRQALALSVRSRGSCHLHTEHLTRGQILTIVDLIWAWDPEARELHADSSSSNSILYAFILHGDAKNYLVFLPWKLSWCVWFKIKGKTVQHG